MALQRKIIKDFLIQNLPGMKPVSGGDELAGPCPFCGEQRPKFYIGPFSDNAEKPIQYNCFICKIGGYVTQDFLDRCNIQSNIDPEILAANKGPGYTTKGLSDDITYNLKYNYISENPLSEFKLKYINNRLGLDLTYDDIIQNKIVLNLYDLLEYNKINYRTRPEETMDVLNKYFIGFLSRSCASLNMRNLAFKSILADSFHDAVKSKYHNYNVFKNTPDNDFYILPNTIDLSKPIRVYIAEGPFDVLGIRYNLVKSIDNCVYMAGKGKAYDTAMYWIITNLASTSLEIHMFPDKDVSNGDIMEIIKRYSFFPYKFFIHNNTYGTEKDYGVPEWKISDFYWEVK